MATVPISTIIKRVNTLLVDPTFTRWPKQELLDYYNDATKAIVLVRPDAHTKNVEFICVAGTKQALPADALRLIEVLRNANGKVIRFVPRKALDQTDIATAGLENVTVATAGTPNRRPGPR